MGKISVAMTTYNGEKYVEKQLHSLLEQTRPADEVIIRDDYSSDRTAILVKAFIDENKLAKWHFITNESNLGFKRNFYEAIRETTGDIVFLCDQDDIWHPDKLERMEAVFTENEAILALNSSFVLVGSNEEPIHLDFRKGFVNNNLIQLNRTADQNELIQMGFLDILNNNISPGCTVAFRSKIREIYLKQTTFDIPHDWELNMIASALDGLYYYHTPLIRYRIHDCNTLGFASILNGKSNGNPGEYIRRLDKARQWCESITVFEKYKTLLKPDDLFKFHNYRDFFFSRKRAFERHSVFAVLLLYRYRKEYCTINTWKGRLADIVCTILPAGKDKKK